MPFTYTDIMSRTGYIQRSGLYPYTGHNAILYARWLPYSVIVPILGAVGIILSLFLPWLSFGNTIGNFSPPSDTGFQVADGNILLFKNIFTFPELWFLVFFCVVVIGLSAILFGSKVITSWISISIGTAFGLAFLLQVVYLFFVLYQVHFALPPDNPTGPAYGLWVCMAVTLVAGIASLFLFSNLSWYWRLAVEDVEFVARRTGFNPAWSLRRI